MVPYIPQPGVACNQYLVLCSVCAIQFVVYIYSIYKKYNCDLGENWGI